MLYSVRKEKWKDGLALEMIIVRIKRKKGRLQGKVTRVQEGKENYRRKGKGLQVKLEMFLF